MGVIKNSVPSNVVLLNRQDSGKPPNCPLKVGVGDIYYYVALASNASVFVVTSTYKPVICMHRNYYARLKEEIVDKAIEILANFKGSAVLVD